MEEEEEDEDENGRPIRRWVSSNSNESRKTTAGRETWLIPCVCVCVCVLTGFFRDGVRVEGGGETEKRDEEKNKTQTTRMVPSTVEGPPSM